LYGTTWQENTIRFYRHDSEWCSEIQIASCPSADITIAMLGYHMQQCILVYEVRFKKLSGIAF
jgi:hypothetical protein